MNLRPITAGVLYPRSLCIKGNNRFTGYRVAWAQGLTLGGIEPPAASFGGLIYADTRRAMVVGGIQLPCMPMTRFGDYFSFRKINEKIYVGHVYATHYSVIFGTPVESHHR